MAAAPGAAVAVAAQCTATAEMVAQPEDQVAAAAVAAMAAQPQAVAVVVQDQETMALLEAVALRLLRPAITAALAWLPQAASAAVPGRHPLVVRRTKTRSLSS